MKGKAVYLSSIPQTAVVLASRFSVGWSRLPFFHSLTRLLSKIIQLKIKIIVNFFVATCIILRTRIKLNSNSRSQNKKMSNGCYIACYHCKEEIYLDQIGWQICAQTHHPQLYSYAEVLTSPLEDEEWDIGTPEMVAELKQTVLNFLEEHQGHLVYMRSDDDIRYYGSYKAPELQLSEELEILTTPQTGYQTWIGTVAFSPDGRYLASGGGDRLIKIWDVLSRENIANLEGHQDWISTVSFSPDGRFLLSGSGDRAIKIWDYQKREEKKSWDAATIDFDAGMTENPILAALWTPDGKNIISCDRHYRDRFKIWSAKTQKNKQILPSKRDNPNITKLALSPTGKYLAASEEPIALSPDGQYLASVLLAGDTFQTRRYQINIWAVESGDLVQTLDVFKTIYGRIYDLIFTPDNNYIICTTEEIVREERQQEAQYFTDSYWSEKNSIQVYSLASGERIKTVTGYLTIISSLTMSADGKYLAAGSYNGSILLWDMSWLNCAIAESDSFPLVEMKMAKLCDRNLPSQIKLWNFS